MPSNWWLFRRSSLKVPSGGFTLGSSNLGNFFRRSPLETEHAETLELYRRVKAAHEASPFADSSAPTMVCGRVLDAVRSEIPIPEAYWAPLVDAIFDLLSDEDQVFALPTAAGQGVDQPLSARVELRNFLRAKLRLLADPDRTIEQLVHILSRVFTVILDRLPDIPDGESGTALTVPLIDIMRDPADTVALIMGAFFEDYAVDSGLFADLRRRFEVNVCRISGIDPNDEGAAHRVVTADRSRLPPAEIVAEYLAGTPFVSIFTAPVPFHIPLESRYEHTHILAAQGHGKTQTLQHLIVHDFLSPDPPAMVIIDSQGQMIEKIQRLAVFHPEHGPLANRLIIIDPKDEVPPALNVFDINQERLARYGPHMREQVLNGVLELYSYLFGSLRADLTGQQSTIFRAFARLMLIVPNANLATLYELLVDHKPFLPYIHKLSDPSRSFFLNDFILPAFNPTRQQIRRRLFDILDNYSLQQMLSAPHNRLNMFEALNAGKIIVVNTSKEFFKAEQSAFFGRFFIALTLQAIEERASIPDRYWHPVLLYIDEAQEYFDDQIAKIITELRKYNCGLVFCHHDLSQLPQTIRSAAARCAVQMIGGAIDTDARALASDLRTTAQFILDQKRDPGRPPQFTEYACYVRNQTDQAVSIRVPFYALEKQPIMDAEAQWTLRRRNREQIGILPGLPAPQPPEHPISQPPASEPDQAPDPILNLHHPDLPWRLEEPPSRKPPANKPSPKKEADDLASEEY